jgi:hypothetical protein
MIKIIIIYFDVISALIILKELSSTLYFSLILSPITQTMSSPEHKTRISLFLIIGILLVWEQVE